jgi:hypothetical protein
MTPPAAAAAPAVRRARSTAPSRPRAVPGPRRVSGPARRQQPAAPIEPARAERGVALGLFAALDRLQRHRLLDRLIAGRTWIALVAFALIGIVTLQLLLLTLNGDIGRALEREALLQRENAAMSIEDSELAAGERVEAQAAHLGMQLVPAGALRFLDTTPPGVFGRAGAALSAPLQSTSAPSTEAGASAPAGAGETTTAPSAEAPSSAQAAPAAEAQGASTGAQAPAASTPSAGGEATAAAQAPAATPQPSTTEAPSASSAGAATPAGGTQASPAG